MNESLVKEDRISKSHFSFRESNPTINALLYCTESFQQSVQNNKIFAASLFDISLEFNSINQLFLKSKLRNKLFLKIHMS